MDEGKNNLSVLEQGDSGKLLRSALGRTGYIGELYNARTDTFCSRSLFSSSFPQNLIKTQQSPKSEIEYTSKDQLSDRFDLLKIEPELQLSVLLGLYSLSGNGKYLSEEKKSERIIAYSRFQYFSTFCDKLMAPFNEIKEYVDENVFDDEQYTHVIVEINWGANCTLSLEHYVSDLNKKQEVEGLLKAQMSKLAFLINPKANGHEEYNHSENDSMQNVHLKLYADILPDGKIPDSVEGVVDFINNIPELLKSVNSGKGKPLNYIMMPLDSFKKLCKINKCISTVVKTIDESFIIELVSFFEEIAILKQKLNDLESDFAKHEKYLPEDCLAKIRHMLQEIKINETKLKTDLAEDLPKARAGKIGMKDIIKKKDRHISRGLNVFRIEDFIEEFDPIRRKIDYIKFCLSKNIIYLGRNDDLDSIMNCNNDQEFFVLYTSLSLKKNDEELSKKSLNFFLTEAVAARENKQYIIVDYDVNKKITCKIEEVKIMLHRSCEIHIHDVYKEYERERSINFVRPKQSKDITYVSHKPLKRVALELMCPGSRKGLCPNDPLTWTCSTCKNNLEYGFDYHFYCECGKSESSLLEFRCSSDKHGCEFFPIDQNFPINEELDKLRPLKEMNILILGQTGVGKSTWINSIVNYLQYETLEDAERGGVKCVIPAKFSVSCLTNEGQMEQIVKIGDDDPNENTSSGKSATQDPQAYYFILGDRHVRLIDTPGLGDTRGIEKDKENMRKIIDYISHLDEIHGICILLKPNEQRLGVVFKFCIKELLCNVHKSAARNILFCFTNSRSTFYNPGDTYTVLKKLIKESDLDRMIALCRKTIFCLDNEAFRFLCTLKYEKIPQKEEQRKFYHESWTTSVKETQRLFNQIKELPPHKVSDTTDLCAVRSKIFNLVQVLGNVAKTIEYNVAAIARHKNEIQNSDENLQNLAEKLYIPHITYETKSLKDARTVCTNSKCVTLVPSKLTGLSYKNYTQVCHEGCRVRNPEFDKAGADCVKWCRALKQRAVCANCGCVWQDHMLTTYSLNLIEDKTFLKDEKVENKIKGEETIKAMKEKYKMRLEETTVKFKMEERIIMRTFVNFGIFLKENALSAYNDSFKEYLQYLIDQEKKEGETDCDTLKLLKEMMINYDEQIKILKESKKQETTVKNQFSLDDIKALEKRLYSLELTGKQIEKMVKESFASRKYAEYTEKPLPINNRFLQKTRKAFASFLSQVKNVCNPATFDGVFDSQ